MDAASVENGFLKKLLESPEAEKILHSTIDAAKLSVRMKFGKQLLKAARRDFDKQLSERGKLLLETPGVEEFVAVVLANHNSLILHKSEVKSELLKFASECMTVGSFSILFGSHLLAEE